MEQREQQLQNLTDNINDLLATSESKIFERYQQLNESFTKSRTEMAELLENHDEEARRNLVSIVNAISQQTQKFYNMMFALTNLVTSEQTLNKSVEQLNKRITTKLDNNSVDRSDMMVLLDETGKSLDLILEEMQHQNQHL